MSSDLSLKDLYKTILDDCKEIIYFQPYKDLQKQLDKVGHDLNNQIELYKKTFQSSRKNFIINYAIQFLEDMDNIITLTKTLPNFIQAFTEHDIYASYGFLWCFLYLSGLTKLEDITVFKFDNLNNFLKFLNDYRLTSKIKENYDKNTNILMEEPIDKKKVATFLSILQKKELKPIKINKKNTKKKKDKKKYSKEKKIKEKDKVQKKEEKNEVKKEEKNKEKKNGENNEEEEIKEKETNKGLNNEENNEEDENKEKEKNKDKRIGLNKEKKNNEISLTNCINIINTTLPEEEKKNKESPKKSEIKNEISIKEIPENFPEKEKEDNIQFNVTNNIKANSQENSISHEELVKIIKSMQKQLSEQEGKLFEQQKKLFQHEQRILSLENNQKLLFYQLSIYQSRDMTKNLYFYFCQHLKIPNESKSFFDLKNIMKYLKNDNTQLYTSEQKKKLRKFYKTIFFINKVSNKILHNNLSLVVKQLIKDKQEENDLLSLIPPLDYAQIFETLTNYLNFNMKNLELQEVMKYVYDDYMKDEGLDDIKDVEGEAIINYNNTITILLNEEEIKDVKNMLDTIKIGTIDFPLLCNTKTYDKAE